MKFKFNFWPFYRSSKTKQALKNNPEIGEDVTDSASKLTPQSNEIVQANLLEEYGEEAILAAEAYLAKQDNVRNPASYLKAILKNNWHQEELNRLHANRAKSYWQEFKRLPAAEQKQYFTELQQLIKQKSSDIPVDVSRYGEQILHPSRVIIKDSGSPQYQSYLFWCWLHQHNLFTNHETVEYKFFELFKIIKPICIPDNHYQEKTTSIVGNQAATIKQPYFNIKEADLKFAQLHKFDKFKLYNQLKAQVIEASKIIQQLPRDLQHQSEVIIAGNSKPYGVAYLFWLFLNQTSEDYSNQQKRNLAIFALFEILKHRNNPKIINIRENGDIFVGNSALKWRYKK